MLLQSILFVIGILWINDTLGQHTPYSLQAAVNALHRREAELALKENYPSSSSRYMTPEDEDYSEPSGIFSPGRANQQRNLNRLLAKYLEHEEDIDENYDDFDEENYLANEIKKRSFFRERGEKDDPGYPPTVFREREFQPTSSQKHLAEEFLREIEEERDLEQEEAYKEALRRLWEKYQQQENEVEEELYGQEKKRFVVPASETGGGVFIGPMMQRKRQAPVLPWLPYSKKKRFPVSKRSPKMPIEPFSPSTLNKNENIAKDLEEIFGAKKDEKKKRSTDTETIAIVNGTEIPKDEHHQEGKKPDETEHHLSHAQRNSGNHHYHHGPTVDGPKHSDESHEQSSHEEQTSDEHHHGEDESSEDFDDDDEERKKKRSVSEKKKRTAKSSNKEIVKEDQIIPGDLSNFRKKKSIDWSKYFGIDRKKKSNWQDISKKLAAIKKRSSEDFDRQDKPKKSALDEEKISNMDSKLKSIEDLIIDETIKYTGAHEGITRPEEIRELKDHVLSRLVTAYSLEKMRRALDKLRQSIENENHLEGNEIETDNSKEKAAKRLSVKKESVKFDKNRHDAEQAEKTTESLQPTNKLNQPLESDDKKKKKKRNGGGNIRFLDVASELNDFEDDDGAGYFEPHNDVYLGRQSNGPLSNQCPIIDSMSEKCRGVELLSGDVNQALLPVCGVHQLCYLCGLSQTACDLQYLSDADTICGRSNSECQAVARSVLMILRGAPGPQLGPNECLKNPCLYRVMREMRL